MAKKCIIPTCPNDATARTEFCRLCKHSQYYWNKKRPAQRLARRAQLRLYQNRLITLFDDKEK